MYVIAFYQGHFSYRYVAETSTTIYADEELFSVDTEEEARTACMRLEEGFKRGYSAGDDAGFDDGYSAGMRDGFDAGLASINAA